MLSEEIAVSLQEPLLAYLGTSTADHMPQIHRVVGWRLSSDKRSVRCLIPEEFCVGLPEAVEATGHVALTLGNAMTAKTTQLKGETTKCEPPTAEDVQTFEKYRDAVFDVLSASSGHDLTPMKNMAGPPHLAVEFEISAVYDQTPGPNAGRLIAEAGTP